MKIKQKKLFKSVEIEIQPGELERILYEDELGIGVIRWLIDNFGFNFTKKEKNETRKDS
jgi:hypothetical protein